MSKGPQDKETSVLRKEDIPLEWRGVSQSPIEEEEGGGVGNDKGGNNDLTM